MCYLYIWILCLGIPHNKKVKDDEDYDDQNNQSIESEPIDESDCDISNTFKNSECKNQFIYH